MGVQKEREGDPQGLLMKHGGGAGPYISFSFYV